MKLIAMKPYTQLIPEQSMQVTYHFLYTYLFGLIIKSFWDGILAGNSILCLNKDAYSSLFLPKC